MKLLIASALLATGYTVSQLARSQVSEVSKEQADDAHAADTAVDATGSSEHMIEPDDDSNIVGSKSKPSFDVGILSDNPDTLSRRLATECTQGFVNCTDGMDDDVNGQSCAAACGTECCDGFQACDNFTGQVCMDGSCNGNSSCSFARINTIVNGCNGTQACYSAAYDGFIGGVDNSCQEDYSCLFTAAYGGNITEIVNSCQGPEACNYAAAGDNDNDGGNINAIINGCNGNQACDSAAFNGFIGGVDNSCQGDNSCYGTAGYGGNITEIVNSCQGSVACNYAAAGFDYTQLTGGSIGSIMGSCIGDGSCFYTAVYGGTIGDILNSCDDTDACSRAGACANTTILCGSNITEISNSCMGAQACVRVAYDGGYVAGIDNACNNVTACDEAGIGGNGNLTFGIRDCCNLMGECSGINEATIPDECVRLSTAPSASNAPSSIPTAAPSKNPTKSPTGRPSASPVLQTPPIPSSKAGKVRSKAGKTTKGAKEETSKAAKKDKAKLTSVTVKRTREHGADASTKLPSPSESDEKRS